MSKTKKLFYDCEIVKCIPDYYEENLPQYKYCGGWDDFENMGISIIGTYVSWKDEYIAFDFTGFDIFKKLLEDCDQLIGFNSINFDDNLLRANGIEAKTNYDLLCEVRIASGQPPHYTKGLTRKGYSLDALAAANLDFRKTASGELAPQLWQDGQKQKVIDYCLNDVRLLVELYKKRASLIDPTDGTILKLRD